MAAKKTERKRKPNTWVDRPPDYEKQIPGEGFGNMMGPEETEALMTVMHERVYTWGRFVDGFETEFADFLGVKYAYAVSACTAALEIASKLIGLKEGDEVVTTPITFHATSLAALEQGRRQAPGDPDLLYALVYVNATSGRIPQALSALAELRRLRPDDPRLGQLERQLRGNQ